MSRYFLSFVNRMSKRKATLDALMKSRKRVKMKTDAKFFTSATECPATSTDSTEEVVYEREIDSSEDMNARQNLNKNAISSFMEYGYSRRLEPKVVPVSSGGPDHKPVFTAEAVLGNDVIATAEATTKSEARLRAAERALQKLSTMNSNSPTFSGGPKGLGKKEKSQIEFTNPVPDKDPVSACSEYGQRLGLAIAFETENEGGLSHIPVIYLLLGDRAFPAAEGGSKKEAKKKAACIALNQLTSEGKLQKVFPHARLGASGWMPAVGNSQDASGSVVMPEKNAITILNEYCQSKYACTAIFKVLDQSGPSHKPMFKIAAFVKSEQFPTVMAGSKQDGKRRAAEKALEVIDKRENQSHPRQVQISSKARPDRVCKFVSHFDHMASMTHRKFEELLSAVSQVLVGRKVVASIVMKDKNSMLSRVISLGSGNRCITGDMVSDDGRVVNDSHAEILARRGFLRFLYRHLIENDGSSSLFVPGQNGKFVVKTGVTFHLYISTAPCGDGALFTHSDTGERDSSKCDDINMAAFHSPVFANTKQGLLRTKIEKGEGTLPIEPGTEVQSLDGIRRGERVRIMSCSDKICKWNIIGLQGALLSHFVEPIYLKSITIGQLYNYHHLSRALCCRIHSNPKTPLPDLPYGFKVNHPHLGTVSSGNQARSVDQSRSLCLNWCYGDGQDVEVTDGTKGVPSVGYGAGGVSRLSKVKMLENFQKACIHLDGTDLLQNTPTYHDLKQQAQDYQRTKKAFHQQLQVGGFGKWVSMPDEQDLF